APSTTLFRSPNRYIVRMIPIATQKAITTSRVKMPHFQTRSTFEMNFIAAATSRKPIETLTEFIQPPARGSCDAHCGTKARIKNGKAKTVANASIPNSGFCQSPCDAATRIVPTKGDVQVNDVRVKVSPISNAPTTPLPSPSRDRVNESSLVSRPDGIVISYAPKRLKAKKRKIAAIRIFTQGFAAKRFIPAAPTKIASNIPSKVKVAMMPSE